MGGRGRRRSSGATNPVRSSRSNVNSASSSSGRRRRSSLFVEGGILSDFRRDSTPFTPSRGGGSQGRGSKPGTSDRAKASASRIGPRKSSSNTFGYRYPTMEVQEGLESELCNAGYYGGDKLDESNPMVLVESKENKIVAYLDQTPSSSKAIDVNYDYEYTLGFVLGDDSSHRGLGFCVESDTAPSSAISISKPSGDHANLSFVSISTEWDDAGEESDGEVSASGDEVTPDVVKSSRKNSGFISIGGMKLYTEDISDEENAGEADSIDDDGSGDEESTESSNQGQSESSASDGSEYMFVSDSDIDEDVAEDYLEGIGGSEKVLDAHWLAEQSLDKLDLSDNDSTEKLGGIALLNASREYGMKELTRSHSSRHGRDSRTLSCEDLVLVKDPRSLSGKKKKKHAAKFSQSSPLQARQSKNCHRFSGEKKKHRKEMILVKRRERMLQRGVDLAQINSKLKQIVLEGVDMHSFQPMHHRDCSQVRRLAAIYRLFSSCHGSGKKSFVTVTRTQQTCLPSATDKLRVMKLIGVGDEDSDFAGNEGVKFLVSGGRKKANDSGKKRSVVGAPGKNKSMMNQSYAYQPVLFVSSSVIHSETVIETSVDKATEQVAETSGTSSAANFGAFEVHTKGFGSKMMAKMGYIEGAGLGKDGKGMAQPIEVVQRPKSLGLGLDFSVITEDNPSSSSSSAKRNKGSSGKDTKRISYKMGVSSSSGSREGIEFGAFEQHTKGFGSRMMAKMGFIEGTGLGRNSQGIANPLVAVRRPRARGLGAEGKSSK